MGSIDDYSSGRIVDGIAKALAVLSENECASGDDTQAIRIKEKILAFRPVIVSAEEASTVIRKATTIAVGERVCWALHPGSVGTESVFLDELANAMILSGRAVEATVDEAILALKKHTGHPLVMSMVSGRYLEICASVPADCVFWRAQKFGLKPFSGFNR
jgi:hypothetical protein